MKKVFKLMKLFVLVLLLGCSFSFVACNDDENVPQLPDEVTTETMFGNYDGKMFTTIVSPLTSSGTDVAAKVDNDTIHFESFPVRDIILSIVKDEGLTDQIMEAIGDVSYKVGYEPTLTTAKDSINFILDPKPLSLSITMPSATEDGEPETLVVEVKVEPGKIAGYAVGNANMKFNFAATEVLLGEGEEQSKLPEFAPITFNFDMNQTKAESTVFK